MKFVDEAVITVQAGRGGDGSASFRREKFIPKGGPDGGDGGDGGDVMLVATPALNTLADFRHTSLFKAANGQAGGANNRSGRSGTSLSIAVPPGTRVRERDSATVIGDIVCVDQRLVVARGGAGGRGNTRFKSSTNRTPRYAAPGQGGECRCLQLELLVLADASLLGLPNAGKSTLLRALSRARPRVADYPFTTLHPHLGVVALEAGRSFVLADIPGLVAGASDGIGLGARFLRHLERTRLFLHVVDVAGEEGASRAVRDIERELMAFNPELAKRERWLVLNKMDLIPQAQSRTHCRAITADIGWPGRVYQTSGVTGHGCHALARDVMRRLEEIDGDDATASVPPLSSSLLPSPDAARAQ